MVLTREITFEEGWSNIQKGVTKMIRILEGEPEPEFTPNEYIVVYTTVYDMCNQKPDYREQLLDRYLQVIEDYVKQRVLPSLKEKHGESMLRELVQRWNKHKVMVRWLYNFFTYLDRCSNRLNRGPLKEVGLTCFRDLVYPEMRSNANEAVIALIHKEREGEQIDRDLVKTVLDVYVENGMGTMRTYEDDFESFMLQETASYYSHKASRWIEEDSCSNYMLKSEECLKRERERVTHYLHSSTEPKLVEKVQKELLLVFAKQLLENEHSGCRALLRDDKKDDLSRMYRLYQPIPQGLEPVADLFKQHITREGNTLIKQADDAATDQVVMRKVTELHYKYMGYVTECFQNHTLFNKALKEAFESLFNKTLAGISNAELLSLIFSRREGESDKHFE